MTEIKPHTDSPPTAANGPQAPVLGLGDQAHFQRYQQRSNKLLWGIFVLLLALVGGVVFVLPNYVTRPDPAAVVVVPTVAAPEAPALSPFEEAQKMRQRETAQNTLAVLLELQEELEEQQAQDWAESAFKAAIEQARQGDAAYRQQQFVEANTFYEAGAGALQAIKDSTPAMYTQFLAEANAALLAGNAAAASEGFGRALLIDPSSSEAVAGMERADVLTEVLDLLNSGRELHADLQLEAARERYQQAQALDAAHPEVAAALQQVASDIAARDFAAAMSRGYNALQNDDPAQALRAFEQALAMRPGSAEVEAAMQQARDRQTFAAISVHIDTALMHEDAEAWAQALGSWEAALAVDPNLVDALEGRRRSESRRNLDEFLEAILASPLRVAEPEVHAQARQVVADATRLLQPGPRLQGQLERVNAYLERALVPVNVQLQSDGMTNVTVYRVAELGAFTNHTLSLAPGEYVAVGVRSGYRDVRQEFVVGLDGQPPVVTVACSEAI